MILSEKQLHAVLDHIHKFPKILSSSDYLKINRSVSYMTFFLKEVYDYCTFKSDDIYVNNLRRGKLEVSNLKSISDLYNKYI